MKLFVLLFYFTGSIFLQNPVTNSDEKLMEKAKKLAKEVILIDTHVDIPYRLEEHFEDISKRTKKGDFDYVRAVEGGLNLPFVSIYVPASYQETGGAKAFADKTIAFVDSFQTRWPGKFVKVTSTKEVYDNFSPDKIMLAYGMENGAAIEGSFENLRHFYDLGIRYITLCHSKSNHICDSSYDDNHQWNGLSDFGKKLIPEMNKVGIMIDVSHISDAAFYQVIELTKAPVIASHSSCRKFTPDFERNMSDDMIKKLAATGGVIQINFGSSFLDGRISKNRREARAEAKKYADEHHYKLDDEHVTEFLEKYIKDHGRKYADVKDVAAHIQHVVDIVGIDHVGIGSDYDGVGDSLPTGLKDVSQYPNLIFELLKAGYSDNEIKKICGGNLMRVWEEVERYSDQAK